MYKPLLACALLFSAAACAPTAERIDRVDTLEDINCSTRPGCTYENSPVKVVDDPIELPRRPYKFFPLAEPLNFHDARNRDWVAPRGTLTDGASIPPIFVSLVGSPTAPEYVNAAAIHDAYCGVGNEGGRNFHNGRWEDVHRMFYDALVAGGTPDQRAKVMYAAVWLGGPRWRTYQDLSLIPPATKRNAMRKAMKYVEENDPSLSQLERKLLRLQAEMYEQHADLYQNLSRGDGSAEEREPEAEEEYPEEDYYDEECGGGGCEQSATPPTNEAGRTFARL